MQDYKSTIRWQSLIVSNENMGDGMYRHASKVLPSLPSITAAEHLKSSNQP